MDNSNSLHIVLFTGIHPVLSLFIEQFARYLDDRFIDYYIADADCPETYNCDKFYNYIAQNNVAVFMFNNIGSYITTTTGNNLWKENSIPVFDWLVDHPRHFGDTLRNPKCDIYAFGLDLDHIAFMKEHYPFLKGVYFAPNGGSKLNLDIPYKERTIDVIYMGDCQAPLDGYPAIDFFKDKGQNYYESVVPMLLDDLSLTSEEVINLYLTQNNINLNEEEMYLLQTISGKYIEWPARRQTKLLGMKALDDFGVHVDVYGLCWPDDGFFSSNITLHGRIDIHELLPKVCNSKISLCFTPWFKNGCSEKNFDSMLNGSLCVSDSTSYLKQHYVDGQNIIFFDLNNPAQMAADIHWLLEHPVSASGIASKGQETASIYDSWENRFDLVINKMQKALGCS